MSERQSAPEQLAAGKSQGGAGATYKVAPGRSGQGPGPDPGVGVGTLLVVLRGSGWWGYRASQMRV